MSFTENPCLGLYFLVDHKTRADSIIQHISLAWAHDPLTTLKLIFCNLRGVRRTGTSRNDGFYTAALWLHSHHPKTFACNLPCFFEFGYFPEVLFRVPGMTQSDMNALERYNSDPDFRFLHDRVSDLLSCFLRSDMEALRSDKVNKIGLAAKWCSSLDSSFEQAIARKVFPKEEYVEYSDVEDAHYAFQVCDRLREEVLVPLRKALELPEVFRAVNKWEELPYNQVASAVMETFKDLFVTHDGALLPHEIIARLVGGDDGDDVAELQWKRVVEDMSNVGKLTNCIAICDVSGSMEGTPMDVCVALGFLLSELSDKPWKGKVITFSENPQLHLIEGDTLKSKTQFIQQMKWWMNTDFQKAFDQILNVAVQGGLPGDKMVKTVFVFSDKEFSRASANPWENDYVAIKRKFEEKGYGDQLPEIVFWNLRVSRAKAVLNHEEGVTLVNGFSKNMMKLFMEGKDMEVDSEPMMEADIADDEYAKLVVLD